MGRPSASAAAAAAASVSNTTSTTPPTAAAVATDHVAAAIEAVVAAADDGHRVLLRKCLTKGCRDFFDDPDSQLFHWYQIHSGADQRNHCDKCSRNFPTWQKKRSHEASCRRQR